MGLDSLYKAFSSGVDAVTKEKEFFNRLMDIGLNIEELKGVLEEDNDKQLCLSGAGSGKTTALSLKILYNFYMTEEPQKALVTTFIRSGADDLKKEIASWARKLKINIPVGSYTVKTIHAECYDSLKYIGVPIKLIETTEQMRIVGKIVKTFNLKPEAWATEFTVRQDIMSFLTYALNRLDMSRYSHPVVTQYNLTPNMVMAMLELYKEEKLALGVMDFEDLMALLLQGAENNENIMNYLQGKYDVIYVDEFQDVSQLQYAVLKNYFRYAKVFCVGDDDQSIYSWRGSDSTILGRYQKDYKSALSVLGYNYRCVQGVLAPILPSIELNKTRIPKNLRSFNKDKGEVILVDYEKHQEILNSIVTDVEKGTVGVICRTNVLSSIFAMNLYDYNFHRSVEEQLKVKMSGHDLALIFRVFDIYELTKPVVTDSFEVILATLFKPYVRGEVKALTAALKVNNLTLATIDVEDVRVSFPNLVDLVEGYQQVKSEDVDELVMLRFEFLLGYLLVNLMGDSNYVLYMRLITKFVLGVLGRGMSLGVWETYKDDFRGFVFNAVAMKGKADIDITTAHDSKGKEWDSVYLTYNIKGVYPLENSTIVNDVAYIEEERRLHYIAWTRAKYKLTILTRILNQSMFLREADLSLHDDYEPEGSLVGVELPSLPTKEVLVNEDLNRGVVEESQLLRNFIVTASTVYDDPTISLVSNMLSTSDCEVELAALRKDYGTDNVKDILKMSEVDNIMEVILQS